MHLQNIKVLPLEAMHLHQTLESLGSFNGMFWEDQFKVHRMFQPQLRFRILRPFLQLQEGLSLLMAEAILLKQVLYGVQPITYQRWNPIKGLVS